MRRASLFAAHLSNPVWRLPILVFLLSLMAGGWLFFKAESNRREIDMVRANQLVTSYASALTHQFDHALSAANALAIMVHQGKGQVNEFPRLAGYMLNMYKGAYALSLAPDGIVRQIEPAAGNASVLGHDMLAGADRAAQIARMDPNVVQFYGPIRLLQGPTGAVGKLPVFLKDANGHSYFWGYAAVTLKFPDAFSDAHLEDIEALGYSYRLSGKNPETGATEQIASSRTPLAGRSFQRPIKVGGTEWILEVRKQSRWQHWARLLFEALITLCGSLFIGWLAHLLGGVFHSRKELQSIAQYDVLTGLPNRRLLDSRLKKAIAGSLGKKHQVAICFLDLDGFKEVNDQLGHAAGDKLLQQMALRLQQCMRATDTLARFGGDEFVVVLDHLNNIAECEKILERMISAAEEPMSINDTEVRVSVSIGVAMYEMGQERDQLIKRADVAMYRAKQLGKGKYVFAD